MGWVRIGLTPEDRRRLAEKDPALLRGLNQMNAEAESLGHGTEEYPGEAEDRRTDTRGFNK